MNPFKTFIDRMGTVKHKFKFQLVIDTLTLSQPIPEEINVIVKRGSQKLSTQKGTLHKGKLDFKKERLRFEEVTMFYNEKEKKYIQKEAEIRVVIYGHDGQKKLAGVIEFDIAEYANSSQPSSQREEKELGKGSDKCKGKLSYEVYLKFLRESNSETASSDVGGLKMGKEKAKKNNDEGKQSERKRGQRVEDQEGNGGREERQMQGKVQTKTDDKKPKEESRWSKPQVKLIKVYYDKEKEGDQQEISHEEPSQNEPDKQLFKYLQPEASPRPQHEQSHLQEQLPELVPLEHQDTLHQEQLLRSLKKKNQELSSANEKLELQTTKLKQKVNEIQRESENLQNQSLRNTSYEDIPKYEHRIRDLQLKLKSATKSKEQSHANTQEMTDKCSRLRSQMDVFTIQAAEDLKKIEDKYKQQISIIKGQIAETRTKNDRVEKENKQLLREVAESKNAYERKMQFKVEADQKISAAYEDVNRLKERIGIAINAAYEMNDEDLTQFLLDSFELKS